MEIKRSKSCNPYKGKIKKKKNHRMRNVLILLGIFILVGLYYSRGDVGGFFQVLSFEVTGALGFMLIVNYIKTNLKAKSKKAEIKNSDRKKNSAKQAGNAGTIKHAAKARKTPVRLERPGKKNFNWTVEDVKDTPEVVKAVRENRNVDEEKKDDEKNRIFIPYRSPFDPIKPVSKAEDQKEDNNGTADGAGSETDIAQTQWNDALDTVEAAEEAAADVTDEMEEEPDNMFGEEGQVIDKSKVKVFFKLKNPVKHTVAVAARQECNDMNKSDQDYMPPSIELLKKSDVANRGELVTPDAEHNAKKLVETLASFGVGARVINISAGPSVTRYELQPDFGVKVSKIVNLADDIALNLAATGVRIEAPIPGKAAIGIEIANREVTPVLLRDVIESVEFTNHPSKLAFAIGKDTAGNTIVADLAKMPHLLVAGATGSGKSVCINALIASILYKSLPSEVKLIMVDPKVVELSIYNGIPHLLIPVVTDPWKAAGALNWAVQEMTNRYRLFAENNVRDLKGYNSLVKERGEGDVLPQIVIIIDELADLMMAAPNDVEDCICRLAQMARAAGMHLVIATQRPSVDVITGLIKANIPSRISFAVSSQVDSRTILDMAGAEKLLGRGDMLFSPIGEPKPIRVQGAFVSDKEVEAVVSQVKSYAAAEYDEDILNRIEKPAETTQADHNQDDELLYQAIEMVLEHGQASTSLMQRKFKVGYSRAARIIDQMEDWGVIGPPDGSKPRKVLITKQEWEELNP